MDPALKKLLSNVHEEIQSTFYGCGSPFPLNLKDQNRLGFGRWFWTRLLFTFATGG